MFNSKFSYLIDINAMHGFPSRPSEICTAWLSHRIRMLNCEPENLRNLPPIHYQTLILQNFKIDVKTEYQNQMSSTWNND